MVHYSDFHIDSRIQRQARALADRGDEVDLICLSTSAEVAVPAGAIRIHGIPHEKARGGARAYVAGYLSFFRSALRQVTALDRERPFDLVEAHNMPDFLAFAGWRPRRRGAPLILNVHDTFPELFQTKFGRSPRSLAVRLIRAQERLSARFVDGVITVTAESAARLASRGAGGRRSLVVMNTPDEAVFGPPRPPVTVPAPGAPLRAIYHGGLAPRFGVELLVDAVVALGDRVPELSLRICGTGTEQEALAARAAAGGASERVDIAACPVPFEHIPLELSRAQVGIVPTLRDSFTELLLPVKLLEYVHMGLPAVAPRLPVIERYFDATELMLFEPGSAESLADAIERVVADRAASVARAERASQRLAQFAWHRQREAYLRFVDDLVGGARGASARKSRHGRAVRGPGGAAVDGSRP